MDKVIKTSQDDWLNEALNCYKSKTPFEFRDDANLGISQEDLISAITLIKSAKNSGRISWTQIATILVGLGMSGLGVWMIAVAVADPEPTSKLAILLAGGVVLALSGSFSTLRALGMKWRVKAGASGFEVHPD